MGCALLAMNSLVMGDQPRRQPARLLRPLEGRPLEGLGIDLGPK